jgi:hypothetical protein
MGVRVSSPFPMMMASPSTLFSTRTATAPSALANPIFLVKKHAPRSTSTVRPRMAAPLRSAVQASEQSQASSPLVRQRFKEIY